MFHVEIRDDTEAEVWFNMGCPTFYWNHESQLHGAFTPFFLTVSQNFGRPSVQVGKMSLAHRQDTEVRGLDHTHYQQGMSFHPIRNKDMTQCEG